MTERHIELDGRAWKVSIAGRFTVYDRDELPLVFERASADGAKERRLARFSPLGSKHRDQALAELTDADVAALFRQSQPAWTSPELGYVRG
jgi:hypothetical protein